MASKIRRFLETAEDEAAYIACLQKGEGYIANCWTGSPEGYIFHLASCRELERYKKKNPLKRPSSKLWAPTLAELEANEAQKRKPGGDVAKRCERCLKMFVADEYDTDMKRESHLVVPGGQSESNRSRH